MADELIAWSDDFSVQNKTIDDQHRELVRMTNELYVGCQKGGILAKVYFFETIKGALHYIKTHFSTEEELMQRANYPGLSTHKGEHEGLVARVNEQIMLFEKQDNPDPAGFVKILMDWILQHIAASDKLYVSYIAKLED